MKIHEYLSLSDLDKNGLCDIVIQVSLGNETYCYIDKDDAIKIVTHLNKIFDIEQKNID
jgi:hypothetical protein